MPTFSIVPIGEARAKTATGKRAALLQEYVGYIQGVAPGEAGMLEAGEGETTQAIRRRLTAAAEALGKNLGGPPHRQRRLLLGVGRPTPRQAPQEPDRIVSSSLRPQRVTLDLFTVKIQGNKKARPYERAGEAIAVTAMASPFGITV